MSKPRWRLIERLQRIPRKQRSPWVTIGRYIRGPTILPNGDIIIPPVIAVPELENDTEIHTIEFDPANPREIKMNGVPVGLMPSSAGIVLGEPLLAAAERTVRKDED